MNDFGQILRNSARWHPEKVAVSCDGLHQTYAELFDRACRIANALAALGCVAGDRVALLGGNSPWTVEHIAGTALGGFVRCGLYAHHVAETNAYLADLVDAKVMILGAEHAEAMLARRHEMPQLEHVIVYDGVPVAGALDYETVLASASAADPHVVTEPDDLHVIRFSAGTTGRPKGIVHTVAGWLRSMDEYRWVTPQLDERDVYLAVGQLTHAAVVFLWPMLAVGGRIVVVPAFEPVGALELIESERVTITLMVPTMMQVLVAHPEAPARDLSSLRCLNYAASPISESTIGHAIDLFGEDVLYQMYAQSEAWPITMLLPHQHRSRPRSVGRPTPGNRVTIVDEQGQPVAPGTVGEIATKAEGLMLGIWKDPDATAARTLPDGSRLTRDMGSIDEDGFVYIADRKEDMIISGGYNIWPAELENIIASHPAVAEVCVVGVPHEKWGETPIAVVVPLAGARVDPDEIIALTRAKAGSVHKVTDVAIVDELPKSGLGKVLRREIRERYWRAHTERIGSA